MVLCLLPGFLLLMLLYPEVEGVPMNTSYEFILRRNLFNEDTHDKNVRPIFDPTNHIHMNFSIRLAKLNSVDIKEQSFSVDAWVFQQWNNPYLTWDPKNYGMINRIRVSPTTIWVPDIVLYNNVDSSTPMAGGTAKFLAQVVLSSDGSNIWSSPVSFTGSCDMDVSSWPFDTQTCSLLLGSMSQGQGELKLHSHGTKTKGDRFIDSGEWRIIKTTQKVESTELGCCPFLFSQYNYTIVMTRRSQYYMVYLILPCTVLAALTLIGFAIPCESGERIGFCITILLAMAVYLLLVADAVPKTSEHIPVLGIYFILSFVEIFVALIATIISLWFHHRSGDPGWFVTKLFSCCVRPCRKKGRENKNNIKNIVQVIQNDNIVMTVCNKNDTLKAQVEDLPKSTLSWQEVSMSFDRFVFWLILAFNISIYTHLIINSIL